MASSERGAAEAARRIADAFAAQRIPYAVGGALALAIARVPRGTADVDINVFIDVSKLAAVFDILSNLGIQIDRVSAYERASADGMFVGRCLERLVAVRPELDHAYVRRWIVDMVGEDDERVRRWDDIVRRFSQSSSG